MEKSFLRQLFEANVITGVSWFSSASNVVVICDFETNVERVVSSMPGMSMRVISNEAGVLIASPDSSLRAELGIDPEPIIFDPLKRSVSKGYKQVVLIVNFMATSGIMSEVENEVMLVDHMVRAAREISRRMANVKDLTVTCIIHNPKNYNVFSNNIVDLVKWEAFYRTYERDVLGRVDDEGDDPLNEAIPGNLAPVHTAL